MTRRDGTCYTQVERLEPRRLFTAGDLIDADSLPGRASAPAQELITTIGGKLLAFTGSSIGDVSVARIDHDGTLDATFGDDGWITTGVSRNGVGGRSTVFSDPASGAFGMIYNEVSEIGIAMFDADGNPDTSFSEDGRWQADFRIERVARQSDGKLVIAGTEKVNANQRRAIVRRLSANGTPDGSFGNGGRIDLGVATQVTDIAVHHDDRVLVVANRWVNGTAAVDQQRIARLTAAGQLDPFFGGDGVIEYDDPLAGPGAAGVAFASDASWFLSNGKVLRRYSDNGTLRWVRRDEPVEQFIGVDDRDRLLFFRTTNDGAGTEQSFIARVYSDGNIDRAFRWSGTTPLTAVPIVGAAAVQGDEVVVLGNFTADLGAPALVARLAEGAGLRASINGKGTLAVQADPDIDENDVIEVARRGRDGRIVVRSKGGLAGIDWIGSFAPSRVKRIAVYTFGGNDSVVIDSGVKGSHVNAGTGEDSITGGDGGDLVLGGDGMDNLIGGAGGDRLFGEGDEDFLFGGDGIDSAPNDVLDTRNGIEQFL